MTGRRIASREESVGVASQMWMAGSGVASGRRTGSRIRFAALRFGLWCAAIPLARLFFLWRISNGCQPGVHWAAAKTDAVHKSLRLQRPSFVSRLLVVEKTTTAWHGSSSPTPRPASTPATPSCIFERQDDSGDWMVRGSRQPHVQFAPLVLRNVDAASIALS